MPKTRRIIIFAIGHSTRPLEQFIELLKAHDITKLIDIRTIPKSRRYPQFNKEELKKGLSKSGISYKHMKELGGFRHVAKDSINNAWENASFRGYADYMQSDEFSEAIEKLIEIARKAQIAIMCAEGNPYRCHRNLVADALTARGIEVRHISSRKTANIHKITTFAVIRGKKITYPGS